MNKKVLKLALVTSLVAAISLPSVSSAMPRDGWQKSSNNWYYYSRGIQLENTWKKINDMWYYFDGSGKMKTGWHFDQSYKRWYYFNPSGDMKTGWVKSANQWYFMRQSGQMAESGWAKYKGDFYYFGIDGKMRFDAWIGAFPEENKLDVEKYAKEGLSYLRYYVDKDGKYKPTAKGTYKGEIGQWKDTKEGRFFILSDGTRANGPTFVDGKLYLLLPELKIGYSYAEGIGYSYSDQDGVFQNKENLKFDKDGRATAKNGDKLFENKETGKIEVLKYTVGERNYVATKDDYDDAAKVVERFIEAQNKKDMKLVSSCVLDCKESDGQLLYPIEKRLDNIIKIKYLSYSITDSKYKPAMFTMKNNSKVIYQSGLVILVDYDVDFKKDNQPESEGINKDYYTLVKDENGKFKIVPSII